MNDTSPCGFSADVEPAGRAPRQGQDVVTPPASTQDPVQGTRVPAIATGPMDSAEPPAAGLEALMEASGTERDPGRRYWIEISDLDWRIVFLLYTVNALLSAGTAYTSELASRHGIAYFYPLLWEFTGHYTLLLLLPLMVAGFGRIPIRRHDWYWTVPIHLLISLVLGMVHTLLMFGSRRLVYTALGLGIYDYGDLGYRFLMEYHKQFLHYWIVYAALRVMAHYRRSRQRERQAAALELKTSELQRQLAQVQLQALRSQMNPHFLFNTLNMISSVMYEDVDRADHMISALSRMLRMSLEENPGRGCRCAGKWSSCVAP